MEQAKIQSSGKEERIAILGCGITGLSLAHQLSQKGGSRISLFDSYNRIGGNHISVNIGELTFDIGTFVFSSGGELFKCFPHIQKHYLEKKIRFGRINPYGKNDAYPFSISKYYRQSSFPSFLKDVMDLFVSKLIHIRKKDVPAYAKYYLGRGIYEKSGLKNYVERFYGIPDSEIDLDFAMKRMSVIGSSSSLRNIISKKIPKKRNQNNKRNVSLIRPRNGFEDIYGPLRKQMESRGIEFNLNSKIERIVRVGKSFSIYRNENGEIFDRVICTIPINEALGMVQAGSAIQLPSQKLLSFFMKLDGRLNFEEDVFYNFMADGLWKRLTVYSRLYGKIDGNEYLTVEVPIGPLEKVETDLCFGAVVDHLKQNHLFEGLMTLVGWNLLESAYPIYTNKNGPDIKHAKAILAKAGIELAGRQGNFDYIPSADLAVQKATRFLGSGDSEKG